MRRKFSFDLWKSIQIEANKDYILAFTKFVGYLIFSINDIHYVKHQFHVDWIGYRYETISIWVGNGVLMIDVHSVLFNSLSK